MNLLLFFQDGGFLGGFGFLLPFVLIFAIFYFLIILPQKRQRQQLSEMIAGLKINDEVVTNGGVIGKVKEIRETSFIILSAEKTLIEIGKSAVVGKKP
ncbi:MAG: preprotein translocase subunit YajC [Acidobacteria bacterium]|nr:preprotein translocase subunit YajC [Acidobacteriota bacterium]HCA58288.1 preprotein translocase subunit YajC [Blastocatellia bacterium]HMS10305.1 preprotein translocase subunit YajC [Pyrinomonadaceae bacterium]